MPDTNTSVLGLLLQATGGNDNTWGQNLNDQVIQFLEDKICGSVAIATTGGTTTLTTTQSRCKTIVVTGALVSDATIVVPNLTNDWRIHNGTSGAFGLLVKTSAGTATTVPQGTARRVYCLGGNTVGREDAERVGEIFYHGGSTVPAGAKEADGTTLSRTGVGLDLFNVVGTLHGVGNGTTTFTLPDGKTAGRYLRSRTASVTAGTLQAEAIGAHVHAGSVSVTGSTGTVSSSVSVSGTTFGATAQHSHTQQGTFASGGRTAQHAHSAAEATGPVAAAAGGGTVVGAVTGASGLDSPDHAHNTTISGQTAVESADHAHIFNGSGSASGSGSISGSGSFTTSNNTGFGTETRPVTLVAIMCIRI